MPEEVLIDLILGVILGKLIQLGVLEDRLDPVAFPGYVDQVEDQLSAGVEVGGEV
jgi:hypothetical protein